MLRVVFHPSSGVHNSVSTVPGINETCTGVKYHPKHVEQLTDLNKLYSVASCWIIIAILHVTRSIEHKKSAYRVLVGRRGNLEELGLYGGAVLESILKK